MFDPSNEVASFGMPLEPPRDVRTDDDDLQVAGFRERERCFGKRACNAPAGHRLGHFRMNQFDRDVVGPVHQKRDVASARDFETMQCFVVDDVHALLTQNLMNKSDCGRSFADR